MSLGETRRKLRIQSYRLAAQMISTYMEGGCSAEELKITEDEFHILEDENKRTAEKLESMADKLEGI